MNARILRLAAIALAMILIPNVASAYYAAHMGRWTSRDPFGEVGRIGTEITSVNGKSVGFVVRDQFDPTSAYHDGMNLYQYVRSRPVNDYDPMGLVAGIAAKCNGVTYNAVFQGCCGGKVYNKNNGQNCCNNGVVGPCPPPGASCADEGDWLDCMACCINNGGMHPGVHGGVLAAGARVPKGRVLPGQASTASIWTKTCQRLRLGKNAVRGARIVGRVAIPIVIIDGAVSWGQSGSCAAGCSGG